MNIRTIEKLKEIFVEQYDKTVNNLADILKKLHRQLSNLVLTDVQARKLEEIANKLGIQVRDDTILVSFFPDKENTIDNADFRIILIRNADTGDVLGAKIYTYDIEYYEDVYLKNDYRGIAYQFEISSLEKDLMRVFKSNSVNLKYAIGVLQSVEDIHNILGSLTTNTILKVERDYLSTLISEYGLILGTF